MRLGLQPMRHQSNYAAPFQHHLLRIALICLAPLGLLSLAVGYDDFRRVREQRTQEVHDLAARAAAAVESELQRHTHGLKALSAAANGLRKGSLSAKYKAAQAFDEAFSAPALLVDEQWRVLVHSRVPPDDPQAKRQLRLNASALSAAIVSGTLTNNLLDGATLQKPGLLLVAPAHSNDSNTSATAESGPRYSWVTVLSTAQLRTALQRVDLPAGARLTLWDATGQVITTHPNGNAVEGQTNTVRRVTRPIYASNWTVSAEIDAWPFYRPAIELPLSRGTLVILVVTGILLYVRRSGRRLDRAIHRLSYETAGQPLTSTDPTADSAPRIKEVEIARKVIYQLDRERQRAEQEKQLQQARYVQGMQEALDSLRRSEARMRTVFEGASEGIAILDENIRIIQANRAYADMLGKSASSLYNDDLLDFALPAHRPKHREIFNRLRDQAAANGYATHRGVARVVMHNGRRFTSESYIACLRFESDLIFIMLSRDVTERLEQAVHLQQTLSELGKAHLELKRVSNAMRAIEERERQRVARDLHDGLQQHLGALQIELELAIGKLQTNAPDEALGLAERARQSTQAVISDLHSIVNDLRPRILDELGLKPALEHLASDFTRVTQIEAELEIVGDPASLENLPPDVSSALYRIVQESLNNVRKHAQASFVHLLLELSSRAIVLTQQFLHRSSC